MIVQCPHCGGTVPVNSLGRKASNVPGIEVYDALRLHRSVMEAANELGYSPANIYKVLKANDLKLHRGVIGVMNGLRRLWRGIRLREIWNK